ncbi:hypothetical protein [Bdellovibrio sp.]|uniref:hypothetical protein n=1 Tax=Bdellovibrio TaxID=958 RepID=UPI003221F466
MKIYLKKRIQTFAKYMGAVGLLLAAIGMVLPFRELPILLIFVGMAPILFPKSRWYLLLPFSRKYLLFLHLVESFFFTLISLAIVCLLYLLIVIGRPEMGSNLSLELLIVFTGSFGLLRCMIPVNTDQNHISQQDSEKTRLKWLAIKRLTILLGIYIPLFFIWRRIGGVEPIFWFVGLIFLISMAPTSALSLLVMPWDTHRKWRFVCICLGSVLSILLVLGSLAEIFAGNPRGRPVRWSAYLLGRLPIPLSQERMLSLAMIPNGVEVPSLLKINETTKVEVTEAQWKERTEKCLSNACLDISDSLIPASLTEDQKTDRFIVIMRQCNPGIKDGGYLRCRGVRLSDERLELWLQNLVQSKAIDSWLQSADPLLQFIAIRTLESFTLDQGQTNRIKELQQSADNSVRSAAHFHFAFYAKESCDQAKDRCQKPKRLSELF